MRQVHQSPAKRNEKLPKFLLVVVVLFFSQLSFSQAVPAISSFTPVKAMAGTTVFIVGSNFNANASRNIVYFGTSRATVISANSTQLEVTVPTGATNAPISVFNSDTKLTGYSTQPFMLQNSSPTATLTAANFESLQTAFFSSTNNFVVGDLNGDGKPDLVVNHSSYTQPYLEVYTNKSVSGSLDASSFLNTNRLDVPIDFRVIGLTIIDMNRDGKPDIVTHHTKASTEPGLAPSYQVLINSTADVAGATISFEPVKTFPSTMYNGSGQVMADFNKDGRPDGVFFINSSTQSASSTLGFTRNLTDFAGTLNLSATSFPVSSLMTNVSSVLSGDINGDGKEDLVVTNRGTTNALTNTVMVAINKSVPSSVFSAADFTPYGFALPVANPFTAALGDLDGDGKPDLVVGTYNDGSPNELIVLRNTSSGGIPSFSLAGKIQIGSTSNINILIEDVNGDGINDIVAATGASSSSYIHILKSTIPQSSSGTNISQAMLDAMAETRLSGLGGGKLAIADMDGDGFKDILINSGSVAVIYRFVSQPVITGFSPTEAKPGETVVITGESFNRVFSKNLVRFGNVAATVVSGTATSLTVTVPAGATHAPISITNLDQRRTAASVRFFKPINPLLVLAPDESSYSAGVSFAQTVTSVTASAIGDLNGDGKMDLVLAQGSTLKIFRNGASSGNLLGTDLTLASTITTAATPINYVSLVDVDGDGIQDIVYSTFSTSNNNNVHWVSNTSSGSTFTLTNRGQLAVTLNRANLRDMKSADFNLDGRLDFVFCHSGTSSWIDFIRNTSADKGLFTGAGQYAYFTNTGVARSLAIGDLNKDGKPDVVVVGDGSASGTNTISVMINTTAPGATSFSFSVTGYSLSAGANGSFPLKVALGDLDGDGKLDIAVTGNSSGSRGFVSVLQNTTDNNGVFGLSYVGITPDLPSVASAARSISIEDMNGDGKLDIVVGVEGSLKHLFVIHNTIAQSSAGSTITQAVLDNWKSFSIGASGTASAIVNVADMDGDGMKDILGVNMGTNANFTVYRGLRVPIITDFTPKEGPPGTIVTVTGTGFSTATTGMIGGVAGTGLVVASDTRLTFVSGTASGLVKIIGSDGGGSTSAALTDSLFYTSPIITTQPLPLAFCVGVTATRPLSVTGFNGSEPLTYEWFSYAAGSTTATSVSTSREFLPPTSTEGETFYYAVVKNRSTNPLYNSVTSDTVRVKVGMGVTTVTPACVAGLTTLSATAFGGSDLAANYRYQWFKSSDNIVDAGDVSLGAPNVSGSFNIARPAGPTSAPDYYFVVVQDVSSPACSATPFTSAIVTIHPLPTATIDALPLSIIEGTVPAPVVTFTGGVAPSPYIFTYDLTTTGAATGNLALTSLTASTTSGNASISFDVPNTYGTYTYRLTKVQSTVTGCSNIYNETKIIVVSQVPTISSVSQPTVCGGGTANITLAGLVPGSTSTVTYTIQGLNPTNVTVTANMSGTGSFPLVLFNADHGKVLAITHLTRTDVTPGGSIVVNFITVNLDVSETPTLAGLTLVAAGCAGGTATIGLQGLLPNTTSSVTCRIGSETPFIVTNVQSNASGVATITVPVLLSHHGLDLVVSMVTRTDGNTGCPATLSSNNRITLNINAVTVAGTVTGAGVVCTGINTTNLSITGNTGNVIRWESSTDGFVSDIKTIAGAATATTVINVFATTQYRAAVQNGTCEVANTEAVNISVSAKPTILSTSGGSLAICANGTTAPFTLTVIGGVDPTTYAWYRNQNNSTSGGTVISGATSNTYQPVTESVAGDYYYYAVASQSTSGCGTLTTPVYKMTVKRYAVADDIVVTPAAPSICGGLSTQLTASLSSAGSGIQNPVFSWYLSSTLPGSGAPGATYTTPQLYNPTSFYVRVSGDNVCANTSGNGKSTVVSIAGLAPDVVVTVANNGGSKNQIACNGTSTKEISFTSTQGGTPTYTWTNTDPTIGLAASGTGTTISSFTATNNSSSTQSIATIRVTPFANGCTGVPVDFTIQVTPNFVASNQSVEVCHNTLLNYMPTGAPVGTTYSWAYTTVNTAIGGAAANASQNNNITTSQPLINNGVADEYFKYTITPTGAGGCASPSFELTVKVKKTPFVTSQIVSTCSGEAFTISPSGGLAGQSYQWALPTFTGSISGFSAQHVSQPVISQPLVNNGTANATVTYVVTPYNGICAGLPFNAVVTLKPAPKLTGSLAMTVCNNTVASFTPSSGTSGTTFAWKRDEVPGISNTPVISAVNGFSERLINTTTNVIPVTYAYTLVADGCNNTQHVTVNVNPTLVLNSALTDSTCSNSIFNYIPTSATNGVEFAWTREVVSGIKNNRAASFTDVFETLLSTAAAPINVLYNYTLTLNNACPSLQTLVVTVNPLPSVNAVSNQVVCNNATTNIGFTGSTVTGTVYNWTNNNFSIGLPSSGQDNIAFTATNTGSQPILGNIIVTPEANGCKGTPNNFTITVGSAPVLTSTQTFAAICSNTLFEYTPTASISNTQITWNRPAVSGIVNAAATGNGTISETLVNNTNAAVKVAYEITMAAAGCGSAVQQTIYVTVLPTPSVNNPGNQVVCGSSFASVVLTGSSVQGTVYRWQNDNTIIGLGESGAGSIYFNSIGSQTSTPLIASITAIPEANGCAGTPAHFTITVGSVPVLTSSRQVPDICSNASFEYTPTASISGTDISWSRAEVTGISNAAASGVGSINEKLINNTTFAVQVTYLLTLSATNCTGSSQQIIVVTVQPTPSVDNPGNQVACASSYLSIPFTGSPVAGTIYKWQNSNTGIGLAPSGIGTLYFTTVSQQANTPGMSTVTITPEANGCTGTHVKISLTVNPVPVLSSSVAPIPICSNSMFNYTPASATDGTTFTWTRAAVSGIANAERSGADTISERLVNTTGLPVLVNYLFTLSGNGCTNTQSVVVQVNPELILTNAFAGTSVCSDATFRYTPVSGGNSKLQYVWTRNAVAGISNPFATGTGSIDEKLINTTDASVNVTYHYTLRRDSACSSEQSFTVQVNPVSKLTSSANVISCSNTPVSYVPTANISGTGFSWSRSSVIGIANPPGAGAGNIGESLLNTTANAIPVIYNILQTTQEGCSRTSQVTVLVSPLPKVSALAEQFVCEGNNTNAIVFTGSSLGTIYSWTNSDPAIGLPASGTGNIPSFTTQNNSNGSISALIQVTPENNGCQGTPVTVTRINVNKGITSNFYEAVTAVACPGVKVGPMLASIPMGGDGLSYALQWQSSTDSVNFTNLVGERSRQLIAPAINSNTFYKMTISSGGCTAETPVTKVLLKNNPVVTLTNQDNYTVSKGNRTQVVVTGGSKYQWMAGSAISDIFSSKPFLSPLVDTRYVVRVTNDDGCYVDSSFQIKVVMGLEILPNNVLTPNGDGFNDLWIIKNIQFYPNNKIRIYNASGILVKEVTGYSNDWDGTIGGKKLPSGTYYYNIQLDDGAAIVKGYISILN